MQDQLLDQARAFLDAEWDNILSDLDALVSIDSSDDRTQAREGAPYGPGPRAALDEMERLMKNYGFEACDCLGHCGYFDLEGDSDKQLAVIGHLDVVPAGVGWTHEPFALTREDGCLFGRGVIDDKGPLLMAVHALRFWRDRYERQGRALPVSVRVIFGCAEETGMEDAGYYLAHNPAPDFLFTPDAEFPLCYGEKGIFQVRVKSAPLANRRIVSLQGGTAVNGVPAQAEAVVRASVEDLPCADGVDIQGEEGLSNGGEGTLARICAHGIAAHAATPEGSVNAIGKLAAYLLDNGICNADERQWLEFVCRITATTDGEGLGIACEDADFGALTCVGGWAATDGDRFTQTIDVRFPTTIGLDSLRAKVEDCAAKIGATFEVLRGTDPMLVSPDSPQILALRNAYEQVTGCRATLFTMGGGTYAHHFPVGVSFGAVDEARFPSPEGAGGMHAADEGIAEEALRQALLIYIAAFGNLFDLDWETGA